MNNIFFASGKLPQEQADKQFVDWGDFKTRDTCLICNKFHWWPQSDLVWNPQLKRYICNSHTMEEINNFLK